MEVIDNITDAPIDKITNAPIDTFIIIYKDTCPYCRAALQKLRDDGKSYKGYDIAHQPFTKDQLLTILKENRSKIYFNVSHTTFPMIFLNGRFIGGYDQLLANY